MAGVNEFGLLGVTIVAKWKTVVEMVAVSLLFYQAEVFGLSALVWGSIFVVGGDTVGAFYDNLSAYRLAAYLMKG